MSTLPTRYLHTPILEDLKNKMVFLSGPRQVGKTTFAQSLLKRPSAIQTAYLNWDNPGHRKAILEQSWPAGEKLIIFDEIHKYAKWRNLIKGYYDVLKHTHAILVTGSARLDYYRKGGDSLLGRYHHYRMHPITLAEMPDDKNSLTDLLNFGGFPEPLLKGSAKTLRRWHIQRLDRLIHEDLRDLENVKEISLLERLAEALPSRVGSPLSIKSLSEDLEVDFKTLSRWITILENLFYCYRIPPYGSPKIRAVKKEQKLYLWDWSQIEDPGFRLENMVASHLLKYCHYTQDTEGFKMELRFIRDTDKREVDFIVLKDQKPLFAVECKTGEKNLSPHINYFSARLPVKKFYQVHLGKSHRTITDSITLLPFSMFSKLEFLV